MTMSEERRLLAIIEGCNEARERGGGCNMEMLQNAEGALKSLQAQKALDARSEAENRETTGLNG